MSLNKTQNRNAVADFSDFHIYKNLLLLYDF